MTQQVIGIGTVANDGTGDTARVAFDKVNDNFGELYGIHGPDLLDAESANVLHKPSVNSLDTTAKSCVIAGGGESDASTRVLEQGADNRNEIGAHASYTPGSAHYATISGGYDHRNDQLAGTIAGGGHNLLSYLGDHGVISGGSQNAILNASDYSVIGGGTQNVIGVTGDAPSSLISGGYNNDINIGADNVVGGGRNNAITSSSTTGGNTIAAGYGGTISGSGAYGTIVGGTTNTISATANGNCILGGSGNTVSGAASYAVVVGQNNTVSANSSSFVAGNTNTARNNYEAVVGYQVASIENLDGGFSFSGDGNPWSANAGDSMAFSFTQSGSTTDNTTRVYLTNRSSTVPTVPLNSAIMGKIILLGKRTATASVCGYVCDFIVSRGSSGTITVEQENWTAIKDEPTVGGAPIIRASVTTLGIGVLGANAVTMRWTARLDCVVVVAA